MRRIGFLVVAALLVLPGTALAERARASANQSANSSRTRSAPAPKPSRAAPRKPEPGIAPNALLLQYQRVGRRLHVLQTQREAAIGVENAEAKAACAELKHAFRSIKLDEATATVAARAETASLLEELQLKIDRLSGVSITQECLDNPLGKDCL